MCRVLNPPPACVGVGNVVGAQGESLDGAQLLHLSLRVMGLRRNLVKISLLGAEDAVQMVEYIHPNLGLLSNGA